MMWKNRIWFFRQSLKISEWETSVKGRRKFPTDHKNEFPRDSFNMMTMDLKKIVIVRGKNHQKCDKERKTIVEERYALLVRRKLKKTGRIHAWGWLKKSTDWFNRAFVTKLLGHLKHQKVNMISQLSSSTATEVASGKWSQKAVDCSG